MFKPLTHIALMLLAASVLTNPLHLEKTEQNKWLCSGGKDPMSLSPKQYLLEFSKTKCTGLLIVPCMVSTRLTLDMDCKLAEANYPKLFKDCAFAKYCTGKTSIQIYPPGADVLKAVWWQPAFIEKCVKALFSPQMEIVDGKVFYYRKEGVSARPQYEGGTSWVDGKRAVREKCGFRALNNIVNGPGLTSGFPYLEAWEKDLKFLGYRQGLSMGLIPYDWRLDPDYIVKHYKFREMVEALYEISGKKMVVLTHSYGLNVGFQGVLQFDRAERDKYFESFISVGGPWLGAADPLSYLVG